MVLKKHLLNFILSWICVTAISAQPSLHDTIANVSNAIEFYRLRSAFNKLEYTAITVRTTFKKSDYPLIITDSSSANYYVHRGMINRQTGNTNYILNSRYYLIVNNNDSIISFNNVGAGNQIFQLNIFDSLFRKANIQGLEKIVVNDSTFKLKVYFRTNSWYKSYEITYSKMYQIKKIVLGCVDTDYDEQGNPPPIGRYNIKEMNYSNYVTFPFDISIFNEGKYVRQNKDLQFIGVSDYTNYQVTGGVQ